MRRGKCVVGLGLLVLLLPEFSIAGPAKVPGSSPIIRELGPYVLGPPGSQQLNIMTKYVTVPDEEDSLYARRLIGWSIRDQTGKTLYEIESEP